MGKIKGWFIDKRIGIIHISLGTLTSAATIVFLYYSCRPKPCWYWLALVGISSFMCSLIWMNYMTYRARKNNEGKTLERLGKLKGVLGDEEFNKLIEGLPTSAKEGLVVLEPVGVLDRHEIRRALTISLTIVFFLSLFSPIEVPEIFTWVYLSVIAFYFGSRALEKYAEVKKS